MNGTRQNGSNSKKGYKVRQSSTTHKSVYKPDAVVREPSKREKTAKNEAPARLLTDKARSSTATRDAEELKRRDSRPDTSAVSSSGSSAGSSAGSSGRGTGASENSRGYSQRNTAQGIGTSSSSRESKSAYGTPYSASTSEGSEKTKKRKPRRPRDSGFIKPTDVIRVKGSYDRILLVLVIIITLFGLIMDFSASYAYALESTGDSFFYIKRQSLFALLGFIAMFFTMHFDYKWLRKATVPFYIFSLIMLLGVLAYGVASGEAQRWINIAGVSIQPSEIMKLSLVLMLALYVARNQDRITNYRNFRQSSAYGIFIPLIIIIIPCLFVALESHFSGTLILFAIGMVVLFACGSRLGWFALAGGSAIAVIIPFILMSSYAKERVDMLLHPENYEITGKIWQTMQGLYAIGSGGLFGVGLGNSRQKHLYVSQPQNDFVFSIVCEELGFAGAILVIALFMLIIWRGFVIALKAPDTFTSLIAIGITCKIAIQSILNIAVVTNLIPNTGISLPFFSYGGTALLMQLAEMGIILAISRYSYQKREDAAALTAISAKDVLA